MHRTEASEARPGRIKRQVRIDELPRDPVADKKSRHDPNHREDNTYPAGIVEVMVQAIVAGLRFVIAGDDAERSGNARQQHDGAVNP